MNENNIISLGANYSELAIKKIEEELKGFAGGQKEKAVSKFVASTLTHFCQNNNRFAEAVYKTQRTLSDCCAEVMDGVGNQISDIDVYRGAVRHYFPNSDIFFKMEIQINGKEPSEEELTRKPIKKAPVPKKSNKDEDDYENENDIEIEEKIIPKKVKEVKQIKTKKEKQDKDIIQISIFESLEE